MNMPANITWTLQLPKKKSRFGVPHISGRNAGWRRPAARVFIAERCDGFRVGRASSPVADKIKDDQ
jgi:hypothetical protein